MPLSKMPSLIIKILGESLSTYMYSDSDSRSSIHKEFVNKGLMLKREVKSERKNIVSAVTAGLKESLPGEVQKSLSLASEKGVSAWLT